MDTQNQQNTSLIYKLLNYLQFENKYSTINVTMEMDKSENPLFPKNLVHLHPMDISIGSSQSNLTRKVIVLH